MIALVLLQPAIVLSLAAPVCGTESSAVHCWRLMTLVGAGPDGEATCGGLNRGGAALLVDMLR
jgi:hypothetical protein